MKKYLIIIALASAAILIGEAGAQVAESPENIKPILTGTDVPQLILQDVNDNPFNLNEAIAKQPTILIFYRGGWCPYCTAQLSQLGEMEQDFLDLGYQIIAISPDTPDILKVDYSKFNVHYTLLSDGDMKAAKAFGLAYKVSDEYYKKLLSNGTDLEKASGEKHHLLPVPAAYVIGTDNKIKFQYVNPDYRVRVNARVLYVAAEEALKDKQ